MADSPDRSQGFAIPGPAAPDRRPRCLRARRLPFALKLICLGVLSATAIPQPARASDSYRGQLYCRNIAALWTQPSVVDLVVTVEGAAAIFQRVSETEERLASVALFEAGKGQVRDGALTLQGTAEKAGFRMASQYRGQVTAEGIVLQGTQEWQGAGLNDVVLRECDGRLAP